MRKVTFEEPIYTYHIDFAGHVSNIVYIQWLENARLRLLMEAGLPTAEIANTYGIVAVLSRTEIRYLQPLFMGDTVRLELWISRLRRASATMDVRFYRGEDLVASAQQDGLFVDVQTKKPVKLGEEVRNRFLPFVAGPED